MTLKIKGQGYSTNQVWGFRFGEKQQQQQQNSSAHLQMSQLANKAAMSKSRTVYTARTLKKQ